MSLILNNPDPVKEAPMNAYECYGEMLEDGHLKIPDELISKIGTKTKVKLLIMVDENEKERQLNALDKLSSLLNGLTNDDKDLFDNVITERVNFKDRNGTL